MGLNILSTIFAILKNKIPFLGKGIRRRVLPATKIPGNWQSFLRLNENKTELFGFLANQVTKIETEKIIVSTIGSSVITNRSLDNVSSLFPSNHEKADMRMLLHAAHASRSGMEKVMIRTVDTDVVVMYIPRNVFLVRFIRALGFIWNW